MSLSFVTEASQALSATQAVTQVGVLVSACSVAVVCMAIASFWSF